MKVLIVDDDINTVDAIRRSLDWKSWKSERYVMHMRLQGRKRF